MDKEKLNVPQAVPILIIVLMIILTVSVAASVKGERKQPKPSAHSEDNDKELQTQEDTTALDYNKQALGLVQDINFEQKIITVLNTATKAEERLFYKGSTDVRDKFNQIIAISQIHKGELIDLYYDQITSQIVKLQISNQAWEYREVGNLIVDKLNNYMNISDTTYKYTEHLMILNEEESVNLLDINNRDELTVKGVGNEIYSIIITKGHGYIRLKNYHDFIGGMVEVGYDVIMPISEDMLIVAREGNYRITLEKGILIGAKNINVLRNEEIIVDMSEYMKPPERNGQTIFKIEPEGAILYIDNKIIEYDKPIILTYGEHNIKVTLGGYNTYTGILNVDSPSMKITIDLTEPTEQETEEESDTDINDIDSEGYPSDNNEEIVTKPELGTTKIDNEHDITIKEPAGAEIYLNGVLKGTVPITMLKEIGIHTISFRKSGFMTKSYTVEVVDDNEDVTFSFPAMTTK